MHVRRFGTLRVRTAPGIATTGLYQEQLDGFLTKAIAAGEAYVARNASFLSQALDRPIGEVALYFAVPLALAIYDLVSLRKVNRATVLGTGVILLVVVAVFTVPSSGWWQGITASLQRG